MIINKIKWKLATQLCPTLCDPTDCSPPGSSVHGILQARILEWIAVPFSRRSSQLRDRTQVSLTACRFFTIWATREACKIQAEDWLILKILQWIIILWNTVLGYPNLSLYYRLVFFSYWIIISFCIINISLLHYYHFILLLKWHIHIADDFENTTNKQTKKPQKLLVPPIQS